MRPLTREADAIAAPSAGSIEMDAALGRIHKGLTIRRSVLGTGAGGQRRRSQRPVKGIGKCEAASSTRGRSESRPSVGVGGPPNLNPDCEIEGKHRPNKDIEKMLLYWAELPPTTPAPALRLNSRTRVCVCASVCVYFFSFFLSVCLSFFLSSSSSAALGSRREGIKTKARISPNIKSSHSQPSQ